MQEPVMARDGTYSVTFTGIREDVWKLWESLKELPLLLDVKKFRKPRSLTANAYAWVLIGKIADKMKVTPEEYYRRTIKETGIKTTIVCVPNKAVQKLLDGWEHNGTGWIGEKMDSKIDGCTNIRLIYGSSSFDSSEMARFIHFIVQDAESLGIPTVTDDEMNRMLGRWKRERKSAAE
jgi:hypothetical protein